MVQVFLGRLVSVLLISGGLACKTPFRGLSLRVCLTVDVWISLILLFRLSGFSPVSGISSLISWPKLVSKVFFMILGGEFGGRF